MAVTTPSLAATKADFPLLHDRDLVYLDSAASAQQPRQVIDAIQEFSQTSHANVHRGAYRLASDATDAFESARRAAARFIGAPACEIVFTRNATEAINLVAYSWARANLRPGDVVVSTVMEHHANIVPWLQLKDDIGIELRFLDLADDHELDLRALPDRFRGARLVCVTAASNVLGTLPPVSEITAAAHAAGALVLVDASQYVPHFPTAVSDLGCDFLAFTGHKMLGPTGIGVLWSRAELLDEMPAFLGGGEMIEDVRLDGYSTASPPWKFEAGTPPIAQAVGLRAAIEYLEALSMGAVRAHEEALISYALRALPATLGDAITILGPTCATRRSGVLSFTLDGVHPHDVAQVLDDFGVCVRAGHHCAKPLMRRLGLPATTRASFHVYNSESDIDDLACALVQAVRLFRRSENPT